MRIEIHTNVLTFFTGPHTWSSCTCTHCLCEVLDVIINKILCYVEAVLSELSMQGTLWFQDLTIADPCFVLPCILVMTNILNIEVSNSLEWKVLKLVFLSAIDSTDESQSHNDEYAVCSN